MNIAGRSFDESSFLFLEAGDYYLGIDEKDIPRFASDEKLKKSYLAASAPKHRRTIHACAISKFFINGEEFARFACATGYETDAEKEGWAWLLRGGQWRKVEGLSWKKPFGNDADELYFQKRLFLPALQVSWNDAAAYCRWLSAECGKNIHLPSEIQWEACARRSGVPSLCDISAAEGTMPQAEYFSDADYLAAILSRTDEAGNLSSGVLWEWCEDWYDAYPGGASNREFGQVYKVLRGGSIQSHPIQRTREYRFRRCPTARSAYYGFRIAVESE